MAAQVAQLIGGAGTGKTTELLKIMDQIVDRLQDPHLIGVASFTRAARREASNRMADRFDLRPVELEGDGWVRTVHSACKRILSADGLLGDGKADREWISSALGEEVSQATSDYIEPFESHDQPRTALRLWDLSRVRKATLAEVWAEAARCDPATPSLEYCTETIERYEISKRLDHRCDFTDLLARFTGWRFRIEGPERVEPEGEPPDLPVWFFDEQQDASPLMHDACLRLTQTDECQWVYVVGDPFQSIYGWSGASPHCFLDGWPVAKRRIMPKSYRCPAAMLELGERILSSCSDYFDRGIAPADHDGIVERWAYEDSWIQQIDPRQSWMLLCRTNYLAARLAKQLDAAGIPWVPIHGAGTWTAPVRSEATKAMLSLQAGAPIDGREWQSILKQIPSKCPEGELLVRGTKTRFDELTAEQAQEAHPLVFLDELSELGATELLRQQIAAGNWRRWIEHAQQFADAIDRWGLDAVEQPQVRVGTIHSAKGAEADNVAVLTTLTTPCWVAAQTPAGRDEEQRVAYVAATRGRRRLLLLSERGVRYRKRYD
ncbi:MAG: UvrD-helicase domain-containing protein [Planctomycetota bacterium]